MTVKSKATDAIEEQVIEWQNRPLNAMYPIVYFEFIFTKVPHGGSVINKAVFLALSIALIPKARKCCWGCDLLNMKGRSSGAVC